MCDRTVLVDGGPEGFDIGLNLVLLSDERLLLEMLDGRFELLHALKDGSQDRIGRLAARLRLRWCFPREHARVDTATLKKLPGKVNRLCASELPSTKDCGNTAVSAAELARQNLSIGRKRLGQTVGLGNLLAITVDVVSDLCRESVPMLLGGSEPVGWR